MLPPEFQRDRPGNGINMTTNRTVDVQAFLNEHPFSGFQWLIFVLCFMIVLLDGFDTAAIGYIAPSLISGMGRRPARARARAQRGAVRAGGRRACRAGPLADRLGRKTRADRSPC